MVYKLSSRTARAVNTERNLGQVWWLDDFNPKTLEAEADRSFL